jgi:hypothetical protein
VEDDQNKIRYEAGNARRIKESADLQHAEVPEPWCIVDLLRNAAGSPGANFMGSWRIPLAACAMTPPSPTLRCDMHRLERLASQANATLSQLRNYPPFQ